MEYKFLKKGDKILTKQLGQPVSGQLLESPKQGKGLKKIVLIFTNASEVGLFDESGTVYARDILKVFRDDNWHDVINAPGSKLEVFANE
jgi:aconitase B